MVVSRGEPPMPSDLAAVFARELREARSARGLTQAEAAERAGIAVEVYGRLERARALPRADTLVRLAVALHVSADGLLGRDPSPSWVGAGEPQVEYADRPEVRRLLRRLEGASPRTVRLLAAVAWAIERKR
jgi:transcriptional regulator with XRE-family HTH domain